MNIYEKLQNARVMLQSKPLKKSGKNTFAKYDYFELEDFLPTVQSIFNEVGLCGVVSFTSEVATLSVCDAGSEARIDFQVPMSSADLKGCHAIQNVGAVISYMRRYLWMLALEIVEHDALDATTGKKPDAKPQAKPQADQTTQLAKYAADIQACKTLDDLQSTCEKIGSYHMKNELLNKAKVIKYRELKKSEAA